MGGGLPLRAASDRLGTDRGAFARARAGLPASKLGLTIFQDAGADSVAVRIAELNSAASLEVPRFWAAGPLTLGHEPTREIVLPTRLVARASAAAESAVTTEPLKSSHRGSRPIPIR